MQHWPLEDASEGANPETSLSKWDQWTEVGNVRAIWLILGIIGIAIYLFLAH